MTERPASRTVHGDRVPEPVTDGERVSGWCELGERLVEKSLTVRADGRLIEHINGCTRCAVAVAS